MTDVGGWLLTVVLLIASLRIIQYYNRNRWW